MTRQAQRLAVIEAPGVEDPLLGRFRAAGHEPVAELRFRLRGVALPELERHEVIGDDGLDRQAAVPVVRPADAVRRLVEDEEAPGLVPAAVAAPARRGAG